MNFSVGISLPGRGSDKTSLQTIQSHTAWHINRCHVLIQLNFSLAGNSWFCVRSPRNNGMEHPGKELFLIMGNLLCLDFTLRTPHGLYSSIILKFRSSMSRPGACKWLSQSNHILSDSAWLSGSKTCTVQPLAPSLLSLSFTLYFRLHTSFSLLEVVSSVQGRPSTVFPR